MKYFPQVLSTTHCDGSLSCGGLVLQHKRSGQFFTRHNLKAKNKKKKKEVN